MGSDAVESLFILEFDIASLHPKSIGKLDFSASFLLILGEERNCKLLFIHSFNNQFNWFKNGHSSWRMDVKVFSNLIFEDAEVDVILVSSSGDSDSITEVVDGFRRVSSSPHAVDG